MGGHVEDVLGPAAVLFGCGESVCAGIYEKIEDTFFSGQVEQEYCCRAKYHGYHYPQ